MKACLEVSLQPRSPASDHFSRIVCLLSQILAFIGSDIEAGSSVCTFSTDPKSFVTPREAFALRRNSHEKNSRFIHCQTVYRLAERHFRFMSVADKVYSICSLSELLRNAPVQTLRQFMLKLSLPSCCKIK